MNQVVTAYTTQHYERRGRVFRVTSYATLDEAYIALDPFQGDAMIPGDIVTRAAR